MSIKVIDRDAVNKICSGQVIVDLATSVKELVENSIDAQSTSVTVILKDMGAEKIEVVDNGSGIHPDDYESIALKHYTSKIKGFTDLDAVASFGFRGEALNSICELSESMTITTKRNCEEVGTQLLFNKNGSLESRKMIARGSGTTVCIDKLFSSLPVRRGEFIRSIKKQYQRLLRVLQSYAVISTGVKITVYNIIKSTKQLVLSTEASKTIEENISSVFGSTFLSTLVPLSLKISLSALTVDSTSHPAHEEEECFADALDEPCSEGDMFELTGCLSKVGEGVGRSDNDRQFVYINGRPVDMPKIVKLFNECWRKFEMKQKPAFIIAITVPPGYLDVNLAPDKREVALRNESVLLDRLKGAVEELYAPSRYTFKLAQGSLTGFLLPISDTTVNRDIRAYDGKSTVRFIDTMPPSSMEGILGENVCVEESKVELRSLNSDDKSEKAIQEIVFQSFTASKDLSGPLLSMKTNRDADIARFKSIYSRTCRKREIEESIFCSPTKLRRNIDRVSPLRTQILDSPNKSLSRVLSKTDFLDMRIIGQFNLGFIIAELRGDLFLLDQHACDEKFNFETLQRSTVIHRQQLLSPLILEVSGADEAIIENNLSVFDANGFRIDIDSSANPGKRLKLLTLPFSKNTTFDQKDVLELASLLHRNPDVAVSNLLLKNDEFQNGDGLSNKAAIRCPKLISMFATRACRSSVMIGTPLSAGDMKKIVSNLTTIDQPWNCPHGRPTLQHLESMKSIRSKKIIKAHAYLHFLDSDDAVTAESIRLVEGDF